MKQSCFGILAKLFVFIFLVGLSDLNKTSVYGQNLNTLSPIPTTPSTFDEITSSTPNISSLASFVSDLVSTLETPYAIGNESSDLSERFLVSDEIVNTQSSNNVNLDTQSDTILEPPGTVDEKIRLSRSNDSSSFQSSTINASLEADEMLKSISTETILLETQEPTLIEPRILEDEPTVTENEQEELENSPKLDDTTSKISTIDENATRGRRFLTPTASNQIHYQSLPSSNNLVDVLSSRLIELYIANVHSTEGLPSRDVLTVLLSPLRVIIEQSINLLGLENCQLVCNNNPQPIYLHGSASEAQPVIFGRTDSEQSRILDVFSKLVNYHKQTSATKTPWLDLLRIISPIDCYKSEGSSSKLEELVNRLISKYEHTHYRRPTQMPMRVPLPTRVRTKPSQLLEDVPEYELPQPRMPILLPMTPTVANYPTSAWPKFQVYPQFQIPQYQLPPIQIRPEITIPNINIMPSWPGKFQPPLQVRDQKMLSPLVNIWHIIDKLKQKEQMVKTKYPIIKKLPLLAVLPFLPKLKPLLVKPFMWLKKSQPKWHAPSIPLIPKFRPIIHKPSHWVRQPVKVTKWPLPSPFIPILPPLRFPHVPQKPQKVILPPIPKLILPKKNPPNPWLQFIQALKNKPKFPLPNLELPRLPNPHLNLFHKPKTNPILNKIDTVLGLLKANKPCFVKKPIQPRYPTPNLPLPPIRPPYSKPRPLTKIHRLLQIPKLIFPKLPLLKFKNSEKPRFPLPVLELPRPAQYFVQSPPAQSVLPKFQKPSFIKELTAKKALLIPLLAQLIPTPQIHINIPNINLKPINVKPKEISLTPNFASLLPKLFTGWRPWLTKWNQIQMPSLPPLNKPRINLPPSPPKQLLIPKIQPIPKIQFPKVQVVHKIQVKPKIQALPKVHISPKVHIVPKVHSVSKIQVPRIEKIRVPTRPKYIKPPCKDRIPGHILFPSFKSKPSIDVSGKIGGFGGFISKYLNSQPSTNVPNYHPYIPYPTVSPTQTNLGFKPEQSIIHHTYTQQTANPILTHQILQTNPMILYQKPIVAPTHIPMQIHNDVGKITTNPMILVSEPGVSTTSIDKDGNLVGKLRINANGKPCIELDHPALQIIAQHEQSSLQNSGAKQGWFELWYNDGSGPEKRRWKLVWNNKEIQDYLHRKE